MFPLSPVVKSYDWGSRTALPELLGRTSPAPRPIAEIWFGAHDSDPSLAPDGRRLDAIIAENPDVELGSEVVAQYGPQLPFLVKLLSADRALSLQAHPSKAEARMGFCLEEAQGIPMSAPNRNYRDQNHKPEILVALSDFAALAGFRKPELTATLIEAMASPSLASYGLTLSQSPNERTIRSVYHALMSMGKGESELAIAEVNRGAARYLSSLGSSAPWAAEAKTLLDLSSVYPTDCGVLGALLLNRVSLNPGQAIFLGPGQLHAYLHGVGVEVMASSDNVLRGGLTSKHVDREELMRVLEFAPLGVPKLHPKLSIEEGAEVWTYPSDSTEFSLSRIELRGGSHRYDYRTAGPEILVCTSGEVEVRGLQSGCEEVAPGCGIWIPASVERVELATTSGATIFRTRVGCPLDRNR